MRAAKVFYGKEFAGILSELDSGEYIFKYDSTYIELYPKQKISFALPVREEAYIESRLFPFFEGLIPEGWMIDIVTKNWKINRNDKMGLLLVCCSDCIGAVSIEAIKTIENE